MAPSCTLRCINIMEDKMTSFKTLKSPAEKSGMESSSQLSQPTRPFTIQAKEPNSPSPKPSEPGKNSSPSTGNESNSPIQMIAIDPSGIRLTAPDNKALKDDTDMKARRDAIEGDDDVTIFKDQAAYEDHIKNGTIDAMKKLTGVKQADYVKKKDEALEAAKSRKGLAPFKSRTSKGGLVTDVPEFANLTSAQLPFFPKGEYIYKSRKRKTWKRREEPGATKNWEMALYQESSGEPLAYNLRHGGELAQTLFQVGRGKKPKKRIMAGMAGEGATPKWKDKRVKRSGEKRKLNKMAINPALVQGHGQDFDKSMKWIGDVKPGTAKPDTSREFGPPTKRRKVSTSDQHPFNFSAEHPGYGEGFRNMVLDKARELDPKGSIVERTQYHPEHMDIPTLPEGIEHISFPKTKDLEVFDSSGNPKIRYQVPQMEKKPSGDYGLTDLADLAQKAAPAGTKDKDLSMEHVLKATQTTGLDNPSLVTSGVHAGINEWSEKAVDTPATKAQLKKKEDFLYLKENDFK